MKILFSIFCINFLFSGSLVFSNHFSQHPDNKVELKPFLLFPPEPVIIPDGNLLKKEIYTIDSVGAFIKSSTILYSHFPDSIYAILIHENSSIPLTEYSYTFTGKRQLLRYRCYYFKNPQSFHTTEFFFASDGNAAKYYDSYASGSHGVRILSTFYYNNGNLSAMDRSTYGYCQWGNASDSMHYIFKSIKGMEFSSAFGNGIYDGNGGFSPVPFYRYHKACVEKVLDCNNNLIKASFIDRREDSTILSQKSYMYTYDSAQNPVLEESYYRPPNTDSMAPECKYEYLYFPDGKIQTKIISSFSTDAVYKTITTYEYYSNGLLAKKISINGTDVSVSHYVYTEKGLLKEFTDNTTKEIYHYAETAEHMGNGMQTPGASTVRIIYNRSTSIPSIQFSIPSTMMVTAEIYTMAGKRVRYLCKDGRFEKGTHHLPCSKTGLRNHDIGHGFFIYRIRFDNKIILTDRFIWY